MDHADATPTFNADEEVDEKTPPVLEDLDAKTLRDMKRGPLWAKVQLPVVARPDAGDAVDDAPRTHDLWLNRTSMLFSEDDPLEYMIATSGTATPALKTEGGEDGVDGEEETPASKKFVGGIEGHGLLAEEVGLGKTVEARSLILTLAERDRSPCAIAPRYEGVKQLKAKEDAEYIAKRFDIVLTTFDVLRKEVAFARKPVQRGLRNKRELRYRRSMLVELDCLRVSMDEAQMVGNSAGATAETASLIARRFSWAVTSTPLRDRITDLKSLLTFLRVEPIASGKTSLQRLLDETPSFKRLWNEIGERTLKSQVQHELFLPKQTCYIMPVDFTAVERFYYDQRYNEALQTLGLSAEGAPLNQGVDPETGAPGIWVPDKPEMLQTLTMLHQICMYLQIGRHNRKTLDCMRKMINEVYDALRLQAVSDIQSTQPTLLAACVCRTQYAMWDKDVENR
ncbi:hypothetical protein Rhopal_006926-T1 [Rhodotorula paludigena]|uniref:SNF2 N-terminal domain-containing protein n=1 Tax=Rhodotorula paludigena TaxID=86838 RepID=A0AAV5GX02_9BASI|nr:hypothetical protein Rhopal_006926-T1 [Rhodotorula paludigena]